MTKLTIFDELKENNEDFEYYPTTKEMLISVIWNMQNHKNINLLDIGAGQGNFKKHFDIIVKQQKIDSSINNYMVIEKSHILLNRLDSSAMVLGTDFYQTTLIDKKCDFIFCNPPYSEYVEWTCKILKENYAKESIFMVIPERWQDNKAIQNEIKDKYLSQVIYSGDFLDAERKARAKINVIRFSRLEKYKENQEENLFENWFKETFGVNEEPEEKSIYYHEKEKEIRNQIVKGENVAERLVSIYNDEMEKLYNNYKIIMSLDYDIFAELNVNIKSLARGLKVKIDGLKSIYWRLIFEELDTVTDKLTSTSRNRLFEKFQKGNNVEFNISNIYAILIWICKNASKYYDSQLVDLFKDFSNPTSVNKYKSNQKTFSKEKWRFADEHSHYTLDYRIVVEKYSLEFSKWTWEKSRKKDTLKADMNDIITVANNLGFMTATYKDNSEIEYGNKEYVYSNDGKILFEYKVYKKGTIHYKFNVNFCKAINVEAGRILGWIKNKADVKKEFDPSLKGAEEYFNKNALISLGMAKTLLIAHKNT